MELQEALSYDVSLVAQSVTEYTGFDGKKLSGAWNAMQGFLKHAFGIQREQFNIEEWRQCRNEKIDLTYGDMMEIFMRFDISMAEDQRILEVNNDERANSVADARDNLACFLRYVKLIADNKKMHKTTPAATGCL